MLMREALAAQQLRRFDESERLYRSALSLAPDQPNALHMLGVVRYELGDGDEAAPFILRALDLTEWKYPPYWHNLGLALARCHREKAEADRVAGRQRADQWLATRLPPGPREQPRIAVVVPCYNHQRFVRRALQSVFEQTYQQIELVVIDDGWTDATAELARQALAGSPFPYRFVTRSNQGAAATINEEVGLSTAPYINVLNSDDWFHEDRLASMVRDVVGSGAQWGFSGIVCVDEVDRVIDVTRNDRARMLSRPAGVVVGERETTGFAFLTDNVAISSGNLFFSGSVFQRIGGFRDLRYNHNWDFCLRALRCADPAFGPAPTYAYRLHGSDTIDDAVHGAGRERGGSHPRRVHRVLHMRADRRRHSVAVRAGISPGTGGKRRDWTNARRRTPSSSAGGFASSVDEPAFAAKLVMNERDESRPPEHVSLQKDG